MVISPARWARHRQKTYFDDFEKLFRAILPTDRELVKELDYEAGVRIAMRKRTTYVPIKPLNRLNVLGILT